MQEELLDDLFIAQSKDESIFNKVIAIIRYILVAFLFGTFLDATLEGSLSLTTQLANIFGIGIAIFLIFWYAKSKINQSYHHLFPKIKPYIRAVSIIGFYYFWRNFKTGHTPSQHNEAFILGNYIAMLFIAWYLYYLFEHANREIKNKYIVSKYRLRGIGTAIVTSTIITGAFIVKLFLGLSHPSYEGIFILLLTGAFGIVTYQDIRYFQRRKKATVQSARS